MKGFYFLLCIGLISVSLQSTAQTLFGMKVGLNATNNQFNVEAIGDDYLKTSPIIGYQSGFWMSNALSDQLELLTELSLSKESYKSEDGFEKTHLAFVNLTSSVQFAITEQFKMGTGPELGFLMSARMVEEDVSTSLENYEDLALGWVFNMSFSFNGPITIGLRYYQGLNDINNGGVIISAISGPVLHPVEETKRNFQLNFFYRF